jgi:hypothetical protein
MVGQGFAAFTKRLDGTAFALPPWQEGQRVKKQTSYLLALACALLLAACSGQPLSTREKGGLLGGALGAGSGAIIGAAVGHPLAGAAIGGPIGLLTGGIIGDSLMGLENREYRLRRTVSRQSRELAHQRAEIRQLQTEADSE